MTQIVLETQIKAPPSTVFDLARDITLHAQGSSSTQERAIAGITEGMVGLGDTVTWRAKHFGIWQELTVVITDFDPPHMFADEMVTGAFKGMRHVHRFQPVAGGTVMIDEFEFSAPLGVLGILAERVFLGRYMRNFLLVRARFLKAQAEKG